VRNRNDDRNLSRDFIADRHVDDGTLVSGVVTVAVGRTTLAMTVA
jgi:hypothetical protein